MMLEVLKNYDKSTAEGLLARTAFSLSNNSILQNAIFIKDEDSIRQKIVDEICKKLKINSISEENKTKIEDYIDSELEKSMMIDKETEEKILIKLSKEGCLPTDLYKIKMEKNLTKVYSFNVKNEMPLIKMTVKNPDLVYNFSSLASTNQEDISLFAKYYKMQYEYNNFFLLIIGKRDGLNFIVNQVWRIYNDMLCPPLSNAFTLLEIFVEKFGVEVEFQGKISKFFSSVTAKNENEFKIVINNKKIINVKKGKTELAFFHFIKPIDDGNNKYSLFFVINLLKYQDYLKKHKFEFIA
jgi:hypothetical protein